jgi:hypothetical protein
MPDNPRPSPNPTPQVEPGELNFIEGSPHNPRMKRRNLKPRPAQAGAPSVDSPRVSATPSASPTAQPKSISPDTAEASRAAEVRAAPVSRPSPSVFNPNPTPSTLAHPSTLYYSTGARKEKEEAPPMKSSIPASTPAPSSSTGSAHATPIRSTAAAAPASAQAVPIRPGTAATPARATSVVDYRANIERQAREQKSIGGVLSMAVYVLIGLFVFGALLAGYGAYVVSKQIHQQSVTVNDLDTRFTDKTLTLTAQLATTDDALAQAEGQLKREQELILRQQDTINKLTASSDALEVAWKQEHQARVTETNIRASETANLRGRVRALESPTHFQ